MTVRVPTAETATLDIRMQWPKFTTSKRFNDTVYGSIDVPYPINLLVDTEEFQRLRNLKQVGLVYLVYPNCEHSRFVHSLGTFYLAYKMIEKLRNRETCISSEDHLCVCIAALLHDIGHGPFSHLFDGEFARECGKSWSHEEMSLKLIDRILLHNEKIRRSLERYLGTGEHYETNVTFIKELINPPKWEEVSAHEYNDEHDLNTKENILNRQWGMRGRGIEKSFLYEIVSNPVNGHDVDKMDYLLRDSAASGVPITLSRDVVLERLFENCRVARDPETGLRHLAYKEKCWIDLKSIGDCRQELHGKVYQHKTVRGIQKLLVKAMILCDEFLTYEGKNGIEYKLSEVINDEEAFLRTSDYVEQEIMNLKSTDSRVIQAKEYIRQIRTREIPCKISQCELSPQKAKTVCDGNNITGRSWEIKSKVEEEMKKLLNNDELLDRYVLMYSELGKGLGEQTHPLERQLFFKKELEDGRDYDDSTICETPIGYYLTRDHILNNVPSISEKWEFFVLGDRNLPAEDRKAIAEALHQAFIDLKLANAQTRKRNNSETHPESNSTAKRRLTLA